MQVVRTERGAPRGFIGPPGVAVDTNGNVYVADSANNTIRKVTPAGTNWVVTTLAGLAGSPGSADGTNSAARFNWPAFMAVDSADNLYVADEYNETIRKVTPVGTNWVVTTLAGRAGYAGSANGTGSAARFNFPGSVAVDSSGNLYVADLLNSTIRKLTPVGTNWVVTTLAGVAGTSGSADCTNSAARFNLPNAVAVDTNGNDGQNLSRIAPPGATSHDETATPPMDRPLKFNLRNLLRAMSHPMADIISRTPRSILPHPAPPLVVLRPFFVRIARAFIIAGTELKSA